MRTFRYRATVPPGGYPYKIPFNGEEILGGDLAQTVLRARAIYVRNGVPIPSNLAAMVEHYICLHVPESFCAGEYEPGDEQYRALSARAVREATELHNTRLKWPKDKFLAPLVEAERRAAICVACKLNHLGFCTTCNGLKGYVAEAVGERRTTVDAKLGVCAVCSCLVKAKVHISADALRAVRKPKDDGEYPDNCWMKEIEHGR